MKKLITIQTITILIDLINKIDKLRFKNKVNQKLMKKRLQFVINEVIKNNNLFQKINKITLFFIKKLL